MWPPGQSLHPSDLYYILPLKEEINPEDCLYLLSGKNWMKAGFACFFFFLKRNLNKMFFDVRRCVTWRSLKKAATRRCHGYATSHKVEVRKQALSGKCHKRRHLHCGKNFNNKMNGRKEKTIKDFCAFQLKKRKTTFLLLFLAKSSKIIIKRLLFYNRSKIIRVRL